MVEAKLQKHSPIPLYDQLKSILATEIKKGTFDDGPMPSEAKIGQRFHVSRTTVRLAMDALVKDGYITRQSGLGTFIIPIKNRILGGTFISIYDDFQAKGRDFETRVTTFETQSAPEKVNRLFDLPSDHDFYFTELVRITNQKPFIIALIYIPFSKTIEITADDFREYGSAINLLEERFGVSIVGASRSLEAVLCNHREADLLEIEVGAPLLMTNTIVYNDKGNAVYFAKAKYRSDLYQYYIPFLPREPIQSALVERELVSP
jgi:GntR family transcriptional regulator